jgi:hypothetical protein
MQPGESSDSRWSLIVDLLSAKLLVWMASVGRDADLTPEAHRYFFDRYSRLARLHRRRGHLERAKQLEAKASAHWFGEDPEPPYAAAMAMPRPRQLVRTDAVSRQRFDPPDDAA